MNQYTLLIHLGWIGVMLAIGMLLRAKIPLLRNMLMPSCVLAGVVGFALMNTEVLPLDFSLLSTITSQLFTLSFISIGLTAPDKDKNESGGEQAKEIVKGSLGIGVVWMIIFALQTVGGCGLIKLYDMITGSELAPFYGYMLARAFAQGPGQAVANGGIFEGFGWENAAMIGLTFAAYGFLFAFLLGVPLARWGLKRNLPRYKSGEVSHDVAVGYFSKDAKHPSAGKQTTHSGNLDSMAFHVAVLMICYLATYYWTFWAASYLNDTWSKTCIGMIFLWGMIVGYIARFILKKLKLAHLIDNTTQKRITGFLTDFLITASFMSVSVKILGSLFIPITIVSTVAAFVTLGVCIFFGQRFGARHDFERTLALYGMATGTAPSGIALARIVDPELKTTTAVEIGGSNLFMNLNLLLVPINIAVAAGTMELLTGLMWVSLFIIPLLILLKIGGAFGKKTYTLRSPCDPPGECDT